MNNKKKIIILFLITLCFIPGLVYSSDDCTEVVVSGYSGGDDELAPIRNALDRATASLCEKYVLNVQLGPIVLKGDELNIETTNVEIEISGLKINRDIREARFPDTYNHIAISLSGPKPITLKNAQLSGINVIESSGPHKIINSTITGNKTLDGTCIKGTFSEISGTDVINCPNAMDVSNDTSISGSGILIKDGSINIDYAGKDDTRTYWNNRYNNQSGTCLKYTGTKGTIDNLILGGCDKVAVLAEGSNLTIRKSLLNGSLNEWGINDWAFNSDGKPIFPSRGIVLSGSGGHEIFGNDVASFGLAVDIGSSNNKIGINGEAPNAFTENKDVFKFGSVDEIYIQNNSYDLYGEEDSDGNEFKAYNMPKTVNIDTKSPQPIPKFVTDDGQLAYFQYRKEDVSKCQMGDNICVAEDAVLSVSFKVPDNESEINILWQNRNNNIYEELDADCNYSVVRFINGEYQINCKINMQSRLIHSYVYVIVSNEGVGSSLPYKMLVNEPITTSDVGITESPTLPEATSGQEGTSVQSTGGGSEVTGSGGEVTVFGGGEYGGAISQQAGCSLILLPRS